MDKSFKHRNFNRFSNSKKKYLLFGGIGIILIGVIIFFLFFYTSSLQEPRIRMVSGTEYISGEEGQVIVRLEDSRSSPITDANCVLSLLYPDKSFFLIDVPMTATSIPGNYYHSFTTPQAPGIYEEHIVCTVVRQDKVSTLNVSYSFHVSPGLNLIVEVSKSQREQYEDLVNRVNNLDSNLKAQINSVDMRVYGIQTYIDDNVMVEIDSLNQNISDINVSLNDSVSGIEGRLNQTMLNNFDDLYSRFRASYDAMANIFGEE
jgi:hypothetical protein